ncbi:hypothetical protein PRZ48_011160 [Zasmidium cellare]|uniref:Uncharacterized protein n=1 Tax=Zasmidium cellare TaxID=395010 RepID=A0ABR0EAL6_ZASCE|nr:hypothetical protein PRZ48_011160 [Zasmidium cellare]
MAGIFGGGSAAAANSNPTQGDLSKDATNSNPTQGDLSKDVQVQTPPEDSISDTRCRSKQQPHAGRPQQRRASPNPTRRQHIRHPLPQQTEYLEVTRWDKKVRIHEIAGDGTI